LAYQWTAMALAFFAVKPIVGGIKRESSGN